MSEVQHSPMLGDEVKSGNTNIKIDSDRLCKLSETKKKKKKKKMKMNEKQKYNSALCTSYCPVERLFRLLMQSRKDTTVQKYTKVGGQWQS